MRQREASREIIAIDARWLHSGLGTYTYNLIMAFARYREQVRFRAIVHQDSVSLISPFCDSVAICNAPIYSLREQLQMPWMARGADLLHVPHYNAPLLYPGKMVISILDLIHITDPNYRKRIASRAYAGPMLYLAARKAAHIITISQFSKNQIVEHLDVSPSKVTVIYCGVSSRFFLLDDVTVRRQLLQLSIKSPYILYVGNLKPHKNIERFLQAFAILRKQNRVKIRLLVVSTDAKGKENLEAVCRRLGIQDAVWFRQDIGDAVLPSVYAGAEFLVLPSLLEGFGLPVLEAMACGTPVVCSNTASLPEVGGDAPAYFNPESVEQMISAVEQVATSPGLRACMREKGLKQSVRFSWESAAAEHFDVFQKATRQH